MQGSGYQPALYPSLSNSKHSAPRRSRLHELHSSTLQLELSTNFKGSRIQTCSPLAGKRTRLKLCCCHHTIYIPLLPQPQNHHHQARLRNHPIFYIPIPLDLPLQEAPPRRTNRFVLSLHVIHSYILSLDPLTVPRILLRNSS